MLWLGANVMLEYDINDAKELLSNNKGNAIKSLEDVNEQMGKFFSTIEYIYHFTSLPSRSNDHHWGVNGPCL